MAERTSSPDWDVVVLGAGMAHGLGGPLIKLMGTIGLYGIQAARTYLDVHPGARLAILESESAVGGTWSSSKRRISQKASRRSSQYMNQGGYTMNSGRKHLLVLPSSQTGP